MRPRVLAIASSGGHFVQLLRTMPAWSDCDVAIATSDQAMREEVVRQAGALDAPVPAFRVFTDANRWQKLRLLRSVVDLAWIVLTVRPDVVITTGAAPGYIALRLGRLIGARTVWIDSIANAEELSLSGRKAERCADLWLTQWADLAGPQGPRYLGSVL